MATDARRCMNVTSLVVVIVLFVMSGSALAARGTSSSSGTILSGFAESGPAVVPFAEPAGFTRAFEGSFGSFPSSSDPQALTVDQATGDIYVLSPSAGTVSRFTSAGAPDDFTAGADSGTNTLTGFSFDGPSAAEVAIAPAGAVGGTAGDIYVASFAGISIYANDGTHLGQITQANGSGFEEACGVATDNTGKVYVGDFGGHVDRYVPSANPASNADYDAQISGVFQPCNVAADSTGAVYASSFESGLLRKYPAADFGTSTPGITIPAHSHAIAVDPSNDDVYVDEGETVAVFNASEEPLYTFGSSANFGTNSAGIAVKGSEGDAYVADALNHQVDMFASAAVPPPTVITGEAGELHHTTATLNGHLDPDGNGEVTDCHFEWGTTNTYGNTVPCTQGNDYTTATDVSATITGLEPGHTYHYRLSASRGTSAGAGTDQTFTTTAVPIIHVLGASFGSSGVGGGQLSGNAGVAIDQGNGDVYVTDTANHRVEEFDSSGTFIFAFGWGVKDGAAAAETCTSGCQAGIAGSGAGQLAAPEFIAVDNSTGPSAGDVYVGDTTNNTVTKFDAAGNYISTNDGTASGTAFGPLAGIAVNTTGDLWVYDTNGDMREFAPDGSFVTKWNSGFGVTPAGIAIDSSETLYVVRGNPAVERLNSSGTDLGNVTGFPAEPTFNGPTTGLTIDPSSGDLYVDDGGTRVRHYINPSTCVARGNQGSEGCPVADAFGSGDLITANGVAVNGSSGRIYVSDPDDIKTFDAVTPPDAATGTASATSATSAILHGTVGPNGIALTDCRFEYVSDAAFLATGFTDLSTGGSTPCTPGAASISTDLEDHTVTATATGLNPATIYHFRLLATNAQASAAGSDALIPGAALVETTGSSTRTATTARLDSRIDPRGAATSYHFEYGDEGPCDSHPCTGTTALAAGSGETFELVSQQLSGLKPGTTYHYRVVADNGTPDGVAFGQDATVTTRVSDAPLTHGDFPGPPGSDRAWEQVNVPDTGGNPINRTLAISENGERAIYAIDGGSPGSQNGGGLLEPSNLQYAERTSIGWKRNDLFPARTQAPGNLWQDVLATNDLSHVYALNDDITAIGAAGVWGMTPGTPAQLLLSEPYASVHDKEFTVIADQANRVLSVAKGPLDPAHPVGPEDQELYELTTGTPRMVGLLPDNSVPPCGVRAAYMGGLAPDSQQWVSPDGAYAVFESYPATNSTCIGETSLFVRDLVNATTTQIATRAEFDRIAGGSVFFTTPESLVPDDHGGTDLYRYDLADKSVICVTCSTPLAGLIEVPTGVDAGAFHYIAVSDDGSHAYLQSDHRLLQGAADDGIYRLDVSTGELAYVAPSNPDHSFQPETGNGSGESAVSPDGSIFAFASSLPSLDTRNGQQNGGTRQIYLYDDRDRSLVCVSCPGDGSAPPEESHLAGGRFTGSTANALSDNGDLVFTTDVPFSPADENTARPGQSPFVGADLYEWRDGQLLLITDGKTSGAAPRFEGISADGRDVFFIQAAQLTPDAPDAQIRLYDARIGGGFDFPKPAQPCSLEACQGNPSPPPDDQTPASSQFSGPGNQVPATPRSTGVRAATKTAAQLRAEKLAKALKACRKDRKKSKRASCERAARKRYGAVKPAIKRTEDKRRGN